MNFSDLTKIGIALLFVGAIIAGFSSCQKEEASDSSPKFLSIDASMEANSPENAAIYREAIQRMDPYVSFSDGKFVLGRVSSSRLAMSKELFAQLKSAMQQSNDILKDYRCVEIRKNVVRLVNPGDEIPLNRIRTRGLGEDTLSPNSTGYDMLWYGFDIYLSRETLIYVAAASGTVAGGTRIVAALSGGSAAIPCAIVGGAATIAAALTGAAIGLCPNGVKIEYSLIGMTDISCQ